MPFPEAGDNDYCLVGLTGEIAGKCFPLREGLSIGRSVDADVFLPDRTLRRHHCRIESPTETESAAADGLEIVRCGNGAPARVNGEVVERSRIGVGDLIEIGRFRLKVQRKDAPSPPGRPPRLRTFAPYRHVGAGANSIAFSGQALVARLTTTGDPGQVPEIATRLLSMVRPQLENLGGQILTDDLLQWRIVWETSGPGIDSLIHHGLCASAMLHQAAFLASQGDRRARWTIGLSRIEFHTGTSASGQPLAWGSGVDEALRLSLSNSAGSTMLNLTGADPGPLVGDFNSGTCFALHGWRCADVGRRIKYVMALRADVDDREAMVVKAAHDPANNTSTIAVLAKYPLEWGESARFSVRHPSAGDRIAVDLECRSCQPVANSDSFRLLFNVDGPLDRLAQLLGLSTSTPPSNASIEPDATTAPRRMAA